MAVKRFTKAQKELRRRTKQGLIEKGLIPPDKKKLNRKKFAVETVDELTECLNTYGDNIYLVKAIYYMLPYVKDGKCIGKVTPEQVGVLKAAKLAVELKKFYKQKHLEGVDTVTIGELHDTVIKPVKDL